MGEEQFLNGDLRRGLGVCISDSLQVAARLFPPPGLQSEFLRWGGKEEEGRKGEKTEAHKIPQNKELRNYTRGL